MLKENTVVSSAVFAEGTRKSEVERGFFRFIDAEVNHGMKYQVYEVDEMVKLPNFNAHKPVAEGVALEPSLSRTKLTREGHVAVVYQGFIAIEKAGERAQGSSAGSDAFFPFPDGPELLADAGVIAICQPGGSIKDDEVTAACDAKGVCMVHTGTRHFRH